MMRSGSNGDHTLNWAERLTPTARVVAMLFLSLGTIFTLGAVVGAGVAMLEDGRIPTKPMVYVVFAGFLLAAAGFAWALHKVVRAWQTPELSAFDRRYYRMWAIVGALGMPIGLGLALGTDLSDPLAAGDAIISNSPLDPLLAIALAVVGSILLAAAAVLYHRTIDDHEERASLWGSTIAFYFLGLAFPLVWLLARGGLIAPLGIGQAMIIVLISFIIQALVWLWFKFR